MRGTLRLLFLGAALALAGCGTILIPDTSGPRYGESKGGSA